MLPPSQLLLSLSLHLPELRLQPADHRAQVLQLRVMPVLGVLQGILQASVLQKRERGPNPRPTGRALEEGGVQRSRRAGIGLACPSLQGQ